MPQLDAVKPKTKRLSPEARRKQITDAARELFMVYGLDGAKTRQIAEAANVTETVLYRHFRSKEEIFEEAILNQVDELAGELLELQREIASTSPQRRVELSQQAHRKMYEVISQLLPLLGVALFSNREAGTRFYRERLMPLIDEMGQVIAVAMGRRQRDVISPRTLFLVFFGMHLGLSLDCQFRHKQLDVELFAQEITDLIAFGIYPSSHQL